MEFTKQFTEAAQNAILRKIEADQWEELPWLAWLVQQAVTDGIASTTITSDYRPLQVTDLDELAPQSPGGGLFLACGCRFGECICPPGINEDQPDSDAAEKTEGRDSFESNDFSHVEGYDWRILVSDRMKNHANSWVENFNRPPTQEEFENQFRHFHARTHYVHVNHRVNGEWTTITTDYVPHWNKEKPKETFNTSDVWPEGKTHRIKFWDQRVGQYNYVYFEHKPGGILLNKYHNAKCFAVVQARTEGV